MLLMMAIGLFTSRVVMNQLGVENYGVWNAVGGIVTAFTCITAAISSAISRFLAFEIGKGDRVRLTRIFSTGVLVQLGLSLLLLFLTETIGMWYLLNKMQVPSGSTEAAKWVLHCSAAILMINMLSVPYNATIIAHERMSAFAAISLVEAILKFGVALALSISSFDKLQTYSILMVAVALIVRLSYSVYCRRYFPESRAALVWDKSLLKEMSGFAGWSFVGSGSNVLNTQGSTLLINFFFGVSANAARGVAAQVENIVKQFVTNFLTALNPQITKSWASGDKKYCFELVSKGAKFTWLIILAFAVPLMLETQLLLNLWLKLVPAQAVEFTRLTIIALAIDMTSNSLLTLQLATGNIKRYYILTGISSILCLPLIYLLFKLGMSASWAYIILIIVYAVVFVLRLALLHRETGFSAIGFLKTQMLRLLLVTLLSFALPLLFYFLLPQSLLRLLLVCVSAWLSLALSAFVFALTVGERVWLLGKFRFALPDKAFLSLEYYRHFGRRLDWKRPRTYNEKLQVQKLKDRKTLYHKLVDKVAVKDIVASKIGSKYLVPTLGVWNSADEIDWDILPEKFVLKCSHDSGSVWLCDGPFDREELTAQIAKALKHNYYRFMREWAYKGLQPRVFAEEYLGGDIKDYKFFCFGGVPKLLFVASDRSNPLEETKFDFFDISFRHLDIVNGHPMSAIPPKKPESFDLMVSIATQLSQGIDQVRVDLYEVDGKVYFGEYTFYHWSGFMPFEPDSVDLWIGSLWEK